MEVAGVYLKSAKVPRKASASKAPEHRTSPSLCCVGLKLSKSTRTIVFKRLKLGTQRKKEKILYIWIVDDGGEL